MRSRLFIALLLLGAIVLGGRGFMAARVQEGVHTLLEHYGLKTTELICSGGVFTRAGHCFFRIERDELYLREQLDTTFPAPAGAASNQPSSLTLGSGRCHDTYGENEPVTARVQLGGGALPYLGQVYFDGAENRGCLEFEYGYL